MSKNQPVKKDKAQALFQKGRYSDAKKLYEKITRQLPADAEAIYMLGVVHGHLCEYPEAIRCFNQALNLYPASAMAHCGLGTAYRALNDLENAKACFQKALQLRPGFADAELELANIYNALGDKDKALELYQKTSLENPGYYKTQLAIGAMLEIEGKLKAAIAVYRKCLDTAKGIPEVHTRLASALGSLGHLDDAEEQIEIARKLTPRSPEILYEMAKIKIYFGKLEEATECFRTIGDLNSDNTIVSRMSSIVGEAGIEEIRGNTERAIELISPLVSAELENPALGALYLKLCDKMKRCAEAEIYCNKLLNKDAVTISDRIMLEYSIGKHLDRHNSYDKAFLHFERANKLGINNYDPNEETDMFDRIMSNFSPAFFMAAPRASYDTEQPVFIVGMPRSGSSLIEQILASHPEVFGAGELNKIADLVNSQKERRNTGKAYPTFLDQETLNRLAGEYISYIKIFDRKAARICDKMPHNYIHLGMISLIFPKARVIHCKRNPMDTCLSIYTQNFNESHTYARDLYYLGRHYRNYERLMQYWTNLLDIKILEIQYEDVVKELEGMSRKLISFCGLEWDDRCLEFHKSKRIVATASYDQVNKPIYSSSVNKWKRYEKFLEPLSRGLNEK